MGEAGGATWNERGHTESHDNLQKGRVYCSIVGTIDWRAMVAGLEVSGVARWCKPRGRVWPFEAVGCQEKEGRKQTRNGVKESMGSLAFLLSD